MRPVIGFVLMCLGSCGASLVIAADVNVFAHPRAADELARTLLAKPAQEISRAQVLRGRFVHRKHLTDIPAPLEATGEFVFLSGDGLYWHTQQPFDSVFVLTPRGMSHSDEGGKPLRVDAATQPAIRAAAEIFLALFAVNLPALDRDFQLFGTETGNGTWQLGLRPKNAALNTVFEQAVISGAAQVHKVELRDARGDRTVIELRDTELLSRAPTPQERALLAQ